MAGSADGAPLSSPCARLPLMNENLGYLGILVVLAGIVQNNNLTIGLGLSFMSGWQALHFAWNRGKPPPS